MNILILIYTLISIVIAAPVHFDIEKPKNTLSLLTYKYYDLIVAIRIPINDMYAISIDEIINMTNQDDREYILKLKFYNCINMKKKYHLCQKIKHSIFHSLYIFKNIQVKYNVLDCFDNINCIITLCKMDNKDSFYDNNSKNRYCYIAKNDEIVIFKEDFVLLFNNDSYKE